MLSPNEGKSPLEQATSVARALMSYTPYACDSSVAFMQKYIEFCRKEGEAQDQWVRHVSDFGERYIHVTSDGRGKSQGTIPPRAKIASVIDTRGEKPITSAFKEFVNQYEHGVVLPAVFPTQVDQEQSESRTSEAGNYPPLTIDFRETLKACDETYNEEKVKEFRSWIREVADLLPNPPDVPVALPNHLVSFSKHLAGLRSRYSADTYLFGSVATAADICITVAKAAGKSEREPDFKLFSKLALYLTSGDIYHPVRILNGIIQQAIDDSFVEPLVNVADNYRERVAAKISGAQSSSNVEDSLDILYEAIPQCHGAHLIYARLEESGDERARGIYTSVDETLVRLINVFKYQIMDFHGQMWKIHRDRIKSFQLELGTKTAEDEAEKLVRRDLIYPEVLMPQLLAS